MLRLKSGWRNRLMIKSFTILALVFCALRVSAVKRIVINY
jgi:hypothetical protein